MITFNNKECKLIKKEYPRIYRYITDFILRHKKELPKILKVRLFDYDNFSNSTCLSSRLNLWDNKNYDWRLDINIKQIFDLYSEPEKFTKKGRLYPGKIKGIRKYLLFVIYHEFGHYNLKHQQNYIDYQNNYSQAENDCDKFAYESITQGQKEFNFTGLLITRAEFEAGRVLQC